MWLADMYFMNHGIAKIEKMPFLGGNMHSHMSGSMSWSMEYFDTGDNFKIIFNEFNAIFRVG